MCFKVKDIEEINQMSDSEIMNYILESSRATQDFQVEKEKLDNELRYRLSINIDDVKHLFDFNHDERIYTFPYLDERNAYPYDSNGIRKVPAKGFFWVINAQVNKKELGLVQVDFSIGKMVRNPNDFRFLKDDKPEYQETKRFYYDYEEEKYMQIPNEANKHKKKNQKEDIHTKEYERREKCLAEIYKHLGKIEDNYVAHLNAVKHKFEVQRYNAMNLKKTLVEFQKFESYLKRFFLVKMIFSHVSLREYNLINDYRKSLNVQVQDMINEIDHICVAFEDDNLDFTDSIYHPEKRITDAQFRVYLLKNKLIKFVAAKDIQEENAFVNTKNPSGYIKNNNKFFPSLGTIELRRFLTDVAIKEAEWKNYEKELYEKSS